MIFLFSYYINLKMYCCLERLDSLHVVCDANEQYPQKNVRYNVEDVIKRISDYKKNSIEINSLWMTDDDYRNVLNTVKTNHHINWLKMYNDNFIVTRDYEPIILTVRDGYINSLILENLRISDFELPAITKIINMNKLTYLNITPNYLSKDGLVSLMETIKNNHVLINCYISYSDKYDVKDIMVRNRQLTKQSVHVDLLNFVIAFAPLNLPPYVLLEIFDWTSSYLHLYHHHFKIGLIVSILASINRLRISSNEN